MSNPVCRDTRTCFGRRLTPSSIPVCTVLDNASFGDKPCPFCKPKRDMTNGVYYPYVDPIKVPKGFKA